jgi:DNA-directed RNA polymerase subunit RPC12/RpoP
MDSALTCPMCGFRFVPGAENNPACPSCPLNRNCTLTCCPNCGFEVVDPNRSQWVGWVEKLRLKIRKTEVSE